MAKARSVADLLMERLVEWGVDTIFGYPGDGVNGLFEGLRTHQARLRFIQVRHEEAAAFAACGTRNLRGGSASVWPPPGPADCTC